MAPFRPKQVALFVRNNHCKAKVAGVDQFWMFHLHWDWLVHVKDYRKTEKGLKVLITSIQRQIPLTKLCFCISQMWIIWENTVKKASTQSFEVPGLVPWSIRRGLSKGCVGFPGDPGTVAEAESQSVTGNLVRHWISYHRCTPGLDYQVPGR